MYRWIVFLWENVWDGIDETKMANLTMTINFHVESCIINTLNVCYEHFSMTRPIQHASFRVHGEIYARGKWHALPVLLLCLLPVLRIQIGYFNIWPNTIVSVNRSKVRNWISHSYLFSNVLWSSDQEGDNVTGHFPHRWLAASTSVYCTWVINWGISDQLMPFLLSIKLYGK